MRPFGVGSSIRGDWGSGPLRTPCAIPCFLALRTLRHLDTCQLKTYIHCRIPRVKCPEHKTKTLKVPWAQETSRFTSLFESMAILFLEGSKNISKTSLGLRISWSEMNTIMKRAVRRGLARRKNETIRRLWMLFGVVFQKSKETMLKQ